MKYVKTFFICNLLQFFILIAVAQTSSTDEVWLPLKYVEDIKQNKTFMNKKKFCDPIEAIITKDGKPYFKTCLGRVVEANFESKGPNRYEIKNVQSNINRKHFSWDAYENYTFTIVHQTDTVLLLIKSPESPSSDTTKFVAPVPKRLMTPIHAVEGYLLLGGKYKLVDNGKERQTEEISFDLKGHVVSPRWKNYRLLASSMILEDKTLGNQRTFLVRLKGHNGEVEERVLLYYEKRKELELYKYTRPKSRYVLDVNSKIKLTEL